MSFLSRRSFLLWIIVADHLIEKWTNRIRDAHRHEGGKKKKVAANVPVSWQLYWLLCTKTQKTSNECLMYVALSESAAVAL